MNKNCARCGKPVYFAERKTSLGREWHPSCLKCIECGKVLSPGQHAEHKGMPYCHHPCYRALFGPAILGYGSNISSPANFAPRKDHSSPASALGSSNRASTGSILGSVLSEESLSPTYSLGRRNKPKHFLVHQNSNGVKHSASPVTGNKNNRDSRELIGGNVKAKRTAHSSLSNAQRSVSYDTAPSPKHPASPSSSLTTSSTPSSKQPPPPPPTPSKSSSESLSLSASAPIESPAAEASSLFSEEKKLDKPL
ncbi:Ras association domain-containing protein 1 [Elysia marginata]|uniref:Ras association domain-containing protein 1 n=1 Tax=Elysia marginata TaxID=1093978 RepID=A0AAV4FFM1_9GAST|nr:Ras association domain-containing protein 1 [Elysia marginata]